MGKVDFSTPKMKLVDEISDHQLEWRNNKDVYATCRQNEPLTDKEHAGWLERIKGNDIHMFGIDVDGVNVGTCGLTSISKDHGTAEYSMLIGPEYQNKGYATRALGLLLDQAFGPEGMDLIWGEIFSGNNAGLKIAQRLGFVTEGMLRSRYKKGDVRVSTFIVSIMRDEWTQLSLRY